MTCLWLYRLMLTVVLLLWKQISGLWAEEELEWAECCGLKFHDAPKYRPTVRACVKDDVLVEWGLLLVSRCCEGYSHPADLGNRKSKTLLGPHVIYVGLPELSMLIYSPRCCFCPGCWPVGSKHVVYMSHYLGAMVCGPFCHSISRRFFVLSPSIPSQRYSRLSVTTSTW